MTGTNTENPNVTVTYLQKCNHCSIILVKSNGRIWCWSWNHLQSCTDAALVRVQDRLFWPRWTRNYAQLKVSGKFVFSQISRFCHQAHASSTDTALTGDQYFLHFQHPSLSSWGKKNNYIPVFPVFFHLCTRHCYWRTDWPQEWCKASCFLVAPVENGWVSSEAAATDCCLTLSDSSLQAVFLPKALQHFSQDSHAVQTKYA